MTEAVFNTEGILEVDRAHLEDLKRRAAQSPRRRFRLCLHRSTDEAVQEMIIAFCGDCYMRPHRHPRGRPETYHVIEGEMTVLVFDEAGAVIRRLDLGEPSSGRPFLYHLSDNPYHMPVPRSEYLVYHETFTGPFNKDRDVEYAAWSPQETDEAGVRKFLKKILT